jgi:hypothetical protein
MKDKLLKAVRAKHAAVMEEALVNIEVYEKAVGIGEHPDLVGAVEEQVDKYVHALEMVEGVDKILNGSPAPTYENTVTGKTKY